MAELPSGLPEKVADGEVLVRFLTQSSHFSRVMAEPGNYCLKPQGILPYPKTRNSSVFRMEPEPGQVADTWRRVEASGRPLKAFAHFRAGDAREAGLQVNSVEPPPRHANLEAWPWDDQNPVRQKAMQTEKALILGRSARVTLMQAEHA